MRKETAKNVMRSGLVVIGAVAFGYISLQLGFKPYLDKAQLLNPPEPIPNSDDQPKQFDSAATILDEDDGGAS